MKPIQTTAHFKPTFCLMLLWLALAIPFQLLAATHTVTVGDNFFSPSELTIQVGDTVRWVNAAGGATHNVTSNNGGFAPSVTASSFNFEVTFDSAGSFPYRCTIHPGSMTGTITVEGGAATELEVLSVNATDGDYAPGDTLSIATSIMNSGGSASGAFNISYYASDDSTISTADHLLGSASIADVGAGATLNHNGMVSVPESVPAGAYFIGAIISFSDSNSANNSNFDASTVTFLGLFFINAGLNDAWVSADAAFQGFFFTVFPDIGFFFLAWFTYDSEPPGDEVTAVFGAPDQRWVSASGFYADNSVTLNVELTSGGIFNAAEPVATQQPNYGTITIEFRDCNTALLTYNFPGLGLSGQTTLSRVVPDNVGLCQVLNEELQNTP